MARAPLASVRSRTLENYGYLCRSTVAQLLTHDQLASFASLARLVRYAPKEVIYSGGDDVNQDAVFYGTTTPKHQRARATII